MVNAVENNIANNIFVDAWKLYKGGRGDRTSIPPNEFNCRITMGLIDNYVDEMRIIARHTSDNEGPEE